MKTLCFHTNSMFFFHTFFFWASVMSLPSSRLYRFSFILTIFLFNELHSCQNIFRLLFHFSLLYTLLSFTNIFHCLVVMEKKAGKRKTDVKYIDSIKSVNKIEPLCFLFFSLSLLIFSTSLKSFQTIHFQLYSMPSTFSVLNLHLPPFSFSRFFI